MRSSLTFTLLRICEIRKLPGGKDNFAADREAAERSSAAVPQLALMARENRKFLGRAVRFCAAAGSTQFLDVGSGLPTMENVHEVARAVNPQARVVYVDNDPVVVNHAQVLLADEQTQAIRGDVTKPDELLAAAAATGLIDFARPVAVLLVAILHFIPDAADPAGSVAALRTVLAPGSCLVISHVQLADEVLTNEVGRELKAARKGIPRGGGARTRDEIAAFFGEMTLVDPGLTEVWNWRPDSAQIPIDSDVLKVIGGVASSD